MITCDRGGRWLASLGYMYGTARALLVHIFPLLSVFLFVLAPPYANGTDPSVFCQREGEGPPRESCPAPSEETARLSPWGRRCLAGGVEAHCPCTPGSRALKMLAPSSIARGVVAAGGSRWCASFLLGFTPWALLASSCFTPPCLLGLGFASLLPSPSRSRRGGLSSFGCSMLTEVPLRPKRRLRSSLRAGCT